MADEKELEEAIGRAAEIASTVPDNLQEAAFNRALDALLGTGIPEARSTDLRSETSPSETRDTPKHPPPEQDLAQLLINQIDATKYPGVRAAQSILDRSLLVLHAARVDYNVDGLTPAEISSVLSEKFRIAERTAAVSNVLGKVTGSMVDRVKEGRAYRYRIMIGGEEHLKSLDSASTSGQATSPKKRAPAKGTRSSPSKTKQGGSLGSKTDSHGGSNSSSSSKTKRNRKAGRSTRPGPKALITKLIREGYFSQPRVVAEISSHIDENTGHSYKSSDLGASLLRLLREGVLSRSKNSDGQYEYVSEQGPSS